MDAISTSTLLIVLVFLIIASAYFSSSETGMMSINRYRLKHLAKENHKGARRVEQLLKRPDRLIGLILIGNNAVNLAAASIATIICGRYFGDYAPAVATFGLTFVILIFAEVMPTASSSDKVRLCDQETATAMKNTLVQMQSTMPGDALAAAFAALDPQKQAALQTCMA